MPFRPRENRRSREIAVGHFSRITRIRRDLEAIFQRILRWLPEKPTATDPDARTHRPMDHSVRASSHRPDCHHSADTERRPFPHGRLPVNRMKQSDLLAYSLYTRGVGLHRVGTPESEAESRRLLYRLRVEFPDHLLTQRALYEQARWSLDEGEVDQAFAILDTLREIAKSPAIKGEAAFLEAHAAYLKGDPKLADPALRRSGANPDRSRGQGRKTAGRDRPASQRRHQGHHPHPAARRAAGSNNSMRISNWKKPSPPLRRTPPAPPSRSSSTVSPITRGPPKPASPRRKRPWPVSPPDLPFAATQLDSLSAAPEESAGTRASPSPASTWRMLPRIPPRPSPPRRPSSTRYPADPAAAEAALTLGRNLFQSGSYNDARLVLEKLAASETDPARAQVAWLLAARSAALGGTATVRRRRR